MLEVPCGQKLQAAHNVIRVKIQEVLNHTKWSCGYTLFDREEADIMNALTTDESCTSNLQSALTGNT